MSAAIVGPLNVESSVLVVGSSLLNSYHSVSAVAFLMVWR